MIWRQKRAHAGCTNEQEIQMYVLQELKAA